MTNPVIDILSHIESQGISYVSWKNNHELSKVLDGNSDLDIIVSSKITVLRTVLASYSWIETDSYQANIEGVYHFYLFTIDRVFHLHVYTVFRTGHSWLKEFHFPYKSSLIARRVKDNTGIWKLDPLAQQWIFTLRLFLKSYSNSSRYLYRSDLDSYATEMNSIPLDNNTKRRILKCFDKNLKEDHSYDPASYFPDRYRALKVRKRLNKYYLRQHCNLYISFVRRLIGKLGFVNPKKKIHKSGVIVAFTGGDGSGKSTIISNLYSCYHKDLRVKILYLGRPQLGIFGPEKQRINVLPQSYSVSSFKKIIKANGLALLRLVASMRAKYYKRLGYLVLADRWPTDQLGIMDGPKLTAEKKGLLMFLPALVEAKIYRMIPKCDLCVYLDVDIHTAVERNKERTKANKETSEEIIARHRDNKSIKPKAKKNLYHDNNGCLESSMNELLEILASHINRNHGN
jgi:thymidylate kinase